MPSRTKAPAKKENPLIKLPLLEALRQFLGLKRQVDEAGKRQRALRDRICDEIQRIGYADEKGSLYIDLDEEVDGFTKVKYQRSISDPVLDVDTAWTFLDKKGLQERCTVMVPEIDEEEILKCHYEGLISQEELDSLFHTTESWSFRQVK